MLKINFFTSTIILSLTLISTLSYSYSPETQSLITDRDQQIYINNSSYTIDRNLTAKGYSLQNENEKLLFMYHGKAMSTAQFYAPSIGSDEAIQLNISLKNTINDATIYLNDVALNTKTDKTGAANIETFKTKGKYHLAISQDEKKSSLNYFFSLDKSQKLECTGKTALSCNTKFY